MPKSILIVEDEEATREAYVALFAEEGLNITATDNYQDAVRCTESQHDKYLVDGNFPHMSGGLDSPNGIRFYQHVISKYPKADFILFTSDQSMIEEARKQGIRICDKTDTDAPEKILQWINE
ncbi:MAG: response regulator [Candidatus Aenigmarchaeota archaeon]|nr:response regulator [Candidatus Aenigmarchaeota archaeon]